MPMLEAWGPREAVAMRRLMVTLVMVVVLVLSAIPALALTPVKVIGGPGHQYWPSSNGTYLTWTSYVKGKSDVYVKTLPSGTAKKVNPSGTSAESASFVGSSSLLVYRQWSRTTKEDIYFYDVTTATRSEAPAAVSKPGTWEGQPVASADYLLFVRKRWSKTGELLDRRLLMYDRHSFAITTLATGASRSKEFWPSFAGSTYVSWSVCRSWVCTIYYWSSAGGKHAQPTVPRRSQFGATIDEATGEIYYVREKPPTCGVFATIRRSQLGSAASTLLAAFPKGIDIGWEQSLVADTVTAHTDLYFERYVCATDTSDVYALRGVDTV
jgi:hypothetical protein